MDPRPDRRDGSLNDAGAGAPVAATDRDHCLALLKAGCVDEALAALETARAAFPYDPFFPALAGHALVLSDRLAAGRAAYREAISLSPDGAETWYALGLVERDLGNHAEARHCQERVVALKPDFPDGHFELAQCLLRDGDYRHGFAEYEWRLRRPAAPERPFPMPRWDGADLKGRRLLLHGEQGMGDVIQMARFIPGVAAMGARITLSCHRPLVPLLAAVAGVARAVAHFEEPDGVDLRAPLLSLPHLLGATIDTLPAAPYLPVPDRLVPEAVLAEKVFKVGIVWAGGPLQRHDRYRSCGLAPLLPLTRIRGVRLFSLQMDEPAKELAGHRGSGIVDLSPGIGDFADTAAIVANLDLVVSVDTAVCHLAGALGRPVWVLLSRHTDWRWMVGRDDSPWYSTMRLFRQSRLGEWGSVVDRVGAALAALVSG